MNKLLMLAFVSLAASAQTISGIVVDEKGAPLAGVLVAHVVVDWRPFLTDANGAFSVSPTGAAIVLRKKGYDSTFVQIGTQRDLRIELHPATEHTLPSCDAKSRCNKFQRGGTLCFPTPAKVSTKLETGIDGATIVYQAPSGKRALHGIGFSWSFGPSSSDVWNSTEYREIAYSGNIIDARGVTGDGKRWRFFGITPGPAGALLLESMEYHNLDEASAASFDQAIDGVCLLH